MVCQEYVRRYFNINPQVWVFIVYAMELSGLYWISFVFREELKKTAVLDRMAEKIKKSEINSLFNEKLSEEEERNTKRVIKGNYIYRIIDWIIVTFSCCYLTYMPLVSLETMVTSKILIIILVWFATSLFMSAIVCNNTKGKIIQIMFGLCDVVVLLYILF